jgi:tRNA-Thr(GGU) m(6)t(6)A37 methyltransferase TsaA
MVSQTFAVRSIGVVRSSLTRREDAPRQGFLGAPEAWIELDDVVLAGLAGVEPGRDALLLTWFHLASRNVLQVHPQNDESRPLAGVFATRSPDRPNPIGLHRVTVLEVDGSRLRVRPLEAIDGTPVIDIKAVIREARDA